MFARGAVSKIVLCKGKHAVKVVSIGGFYMQSYSMKHV